MTKLFHKYKEEITSRTKQHDISTRLLQTKDPVHCQGEQNNKNTLMTLLYTM